jgi:hypothetical protein
VSTLNIKMYKEISVSQIQGIRAETNEEVATLYLRHAVSVAYYEEESTTNITVTREIKRYKSKVITY